MEELLKSLDSDLVLIKAVVGEEAIELHAKKDTVEETCPYCGAKSKSVHSVYRKTISDLPVQEKMVKIILHMRLFFCRNTDCSRQLFSETVWFVDRYGRRTNRLNKKIKEIAMNMSARSAKKAINKGISNISDDTILRILKKTEDHS
jgi:transposase